MKRWWWNIRYAFVIGGRAKLPFKQAYQMAKNSDDSFFDGVSPSTAVNNELECWEP